MTGVTRGFFCFFSVPEAVIGLVDGGLVLLLPETKGKTLPETIDDAENLHRYGHVTFLKEEYFLFRIRKQGCMQAECSSPSLISKKRES